jgi:hypothetical protein
MEHYFESAGTFAHSVIREVVRSQHIRSSLAAHTQNCFSVQLGIEVLDVGRIGQGVTNLRVMVCRPA